MVDLGGKGTQFHAIHFATRLIPLAQAYHYRASGHVYEEYQESLAAGLYARAHGIVLDRLASEAILREDVGVLRKLLEAINDEDVPEWENGGGVSCGSKRLWQHEN